MLGACLCLLLCPSHSNAVSAIRSVTPERARRVAELANGLRLSHRVRKGMSEDEARRLLGEPSSYGYCNGGIPPLHPVYYSRHALVVWLEFSSQPGRPDTVESVGWSGLWAAYQLACEPR